jgi:pimeloyl-ACP methyl ester carboxylesterase
MKVRHLRIIPNVLKRGTGHEDSVNYFFLILAGCAMSHHNLSKLQTDSSWANEMQMRHITVNGVNLRYLAMGDGAPLVLIHTLRTQLEYFNKIIPELAKHFKIYALDLPGHGFSDIPDVAYTEPYYTKSVQIFLERLDLQNVTLVGESIGATIALSLGAKNENNRITKIFALNPYDYAEGGAGGIKRSSWLSRAVFATMEWPGIGWIVSRSENKLILGHILKGGFSDPDHLPEDLLDLFNRVGFRKGYRRAEKSTFNHWKSWVDARAEYDAIDIPVILVYGDSDWSRETERLANHEKIKQSQLITLESTGHFSSLDSPDRVIKIILDHN